VPPRAAALVVALAAAGAAWCAARFAGLLPLLWGALLLLSLAPPPPQRRFLSTSVLALLVGAVTLSWVVALDHELALRLGLVALTGVLLFALARFAAPGPLAVQAVTIAVALTALVALAQLAGGLDAARPAVWTLAPGLREAAAARLEVGRAFGTASLPGHFAILLVTALPLAAARALATRGPRRAAWVGTSLLAVAGIVATRSLAALAVGTVLLAAAAFRRRRPAVLAAVAVLAAAALAIVALRTDLGRLEPLRLRAVNWRTAAWVAAAHPLTGVGLGGVGQGGLTAPTASENTSTFAHCTPLQLAAELGLAGAGLVLAGIVGLVVLLRRGADADLPLALAVAAVPLHNLLDFSFYAPEVLWPWAVLAGTLASRCWAPPRRPVASWLLVPVLVVGTVLAALSWRGQAEAADALLEPVGRQPEALTAASRWQPWSVTPLLVAADVALAEAGPVARLERLDRALAQRGWVRPVSPGWAEARARLLLVAGRRGEALPWAIEARRRAPWRADLLALEELCLPPR